MARLIPAPIDGKNIDDDWIWDTLDAVGTTEDGRNKGAFYHKGILWEVVWRNGDNVMNFRCASARATYKDKETFVEYLKKTLGGDWEETAEYFRYTIERYGNKVLLRFFYLADDWTKESITENIMGRCREQIPHFDARLDMAWERMDEQRCPLSMADPSLASEIESVMEDFESDEEISLEDYDITTAEDLF